MKNLWKKVCVCVARGGGGEGCTPTGSLCLSETGVESPSVNGGQLYF